MRALMPAARDRLLTASWLVLSGAVVFAVVLALAPDVRAIVRGRLRGWIAAHAATRPAA
jgi:hypothetical protein